MPGSARRAAGVAASTTIGHRRCQTPAAVIDLTIGLLARLRHLARQVLDLLRIDVFANAADLAVLDFENEAVFVFIVLAIEELATISQFDNHRVAIAVDSANVTLESFGKNLRRAAGKIENLGLALSDAPD